VVSFHTPSIRDFVEDFLSNSDGDVADLIKGAHFYEQYTTLWTGRHGLRYPGVDRRSEDFLRQLQKNIFGPSASSIRVVNSEGEPIGVDHREVSNESRAEFAVRVANDLKSEAGDLFLKALVDALQKLWREGHADKEDLVRLLTALTNRGLSREDQAFIAAKQCLSIKLEEIDEFRAIAQFAKIYSDAVSSSDLDQVKSQFLQFAYDYSVGWDDDPDWLRQVAADLEFVGERLEVSVTRFTGSLYEKADEIENQHAQTEPNEDAETVGNRLHHIEMMSTRCFRVCETSLKTELTRRRGKGISGDTDFRGEFREFRGHNTNFRVPSYLDVLLVSS
jgi:hypothetical protein